MAELGSLGKNIQSPPGGSYDFSPGGLIADIYHSLEGLVVELHPLNKIIVIVIIDLQAPDKMEQRMIQIFT